MKGVILAGGLGARLFPLTKVTNKHLLPVYNKPMIYYPLETLVNSGIKDIMITTGPEHAGEFLRLLENGVEFNVNLTYRLQKEPLGIAHALSLVEGYIGKDNCAVILGDNIFQYPFNREVKNFTGGAHLFLKKVQDPERFGVVSLNEKRITSIEEKPENPKSKYAITGFYLYDKTVFDIIRTLKPSSRNELEITDVNKVYLERGKLNYTILKGYWTDAGTFESLYKATTLIRRKSLKE